MSETSFIIASDDIETIETELNSIKKPYPETGLSDYGAPAQT